MSKKLVKKKGVEITIQPTYNMPSSRVYSNFAEVSLSPSDFTLRFCDVTPITNMKKVEEAGGVHNVPVVAEIAVPFDFVPNLIKALSSQYKSYQKTTGATGGKKSSKK